MKAPTFAFSFLLRKNLHKTTDLQKLSIHKNKFKLFL